MRNNTTLLLASISIIDKIEKDFDLIFGIFGKAGGKTHNFVGAYIYYLGCMALYIVIYSMKQLVYKRFILGLTSIS